MFGRLACEVGDVLVPVFAWQKKVRADNHPLGASLYTPIECFGDGRAGQFHVGRLNNAKTTVLRELGDERFEHVVGFCASRAVIDDDDAVTGFIECNHIFILGCLYRQGHVWPGEKPRFFGCSMRNAYRSTLTRRLAFLLLGASLFASACATDRNAEPLGPAFAAASIPVVDKQAEARRIVQTLANPNIQGRGWGTDGLKRAGDFLVGYLQKQTTWQPALRSGGFAQPFATDEVDDLRIRSRNVIAMLPGRGSLAGQTVIVAAHYDHLGRGEHASLARRFAQWEDVDPLPIHPGADDNASGVAAALLAMRDIQQQLQNVADHRAVVLLLTTGEEHGFLGSRYFAGHPKQLTFELDQTIAVVNLDMVGQLRDNTLGIYHTEAWPGWTPAIHNANTATQLHLLTDESPPGYGDELIFQRLEIPAVLVHTGHHDAYHTPADTADTLNYPGLVRISRWAGRLVSILAAVPTDHN